MATDVPVDRSDTETPSAPAPNAGQALQIAERTVSRGSLMLPRTMDDALKLALTLSKSSLVPKDFIGNAANVYLAIQWGSEIGLAPMQALQSIAVINGRPSVWGDAMPALVMASGQLEYMRETLDESNDNPVAICVVKRKNYPEHTERFSWEDAERAGLTVKPGPWKTYPKRMLKMRARGFALRDIFPDVLRGVIIAEEAMDMPAIDALSPQPFDPVDAYVSLLEDDEKARIRALIIDSKLNKGQVSTKLKEFANNPKGLIAALEKIANGEAAGEPVTVKTATAPAANETPQPTSAPAAEKAPLPQGVVRGSDLKPKAAPAQDDLSF